jgi:hypothetical protein
MKLVGGRPSDCASSHHFLPEIAAFKSHLPAIVSSCQLKIIFIQQIFTEILVQALAMPFAQLVIGPPGAGKSTYCNGMHQFLGAIGRKCSIVNLDPANDKTSYPCALDVRDLVTLEEIMSEDQLGPNGGVLFALEELEENFDFLEEGLKALGGMRIGRVRTLHVP